MRAELALSVCVLSMVASATAADAQVIAPPEAHDDMQMANGPGRWRLIQDGVVYGLFNHQGGPRGGDEFVVPNWWMGMLMRDVGRHGFGLNAMLSLDPATVGAQGYRKLFQVGETFEGKPLVDRQHPHDLFMQLSAFWQTNFANGTRVVLAGGPVGEPTLGPVAFMHRASAAGLPMAPLGHHTFDSTHISFGVVTAGVERGKWTVEGSVFNAREPDEHRWDFDLGALDSVAGRVWFRPTEQWEAQVSAGLLRDPEELEPGDARRGSGSVSWLRWRTTGFDAVTAGYGVNAARGEHRHGAFGEFTVERGANSVFGRAEVQQVETTVLLTGDPPYHSQSNEPPSSVTAATLGVGRRLLTWRGFDAAVGAEVTFHGVPEPLKVTHGAHPSSFQAFFRVRLPSSDPRRMWNMRMSQGHRMTMDHSGH